MLLQMMSEQEAEYLAFVLDARGCCCHFRDVADAARGVKDVEHVRCDGW